MWSVGDRRLALAAQWVVVERLVRWRVGVGRTRSLRAVVFVVAIVIAAPAAAFAECGPAGHCSGAEVEQQGWFVVR